jgi:hypothetical protein
MAGNGHHCSSLPLADQPGPPVGTLFFLNSLLRSRSLGHGQLTRPRPRSTSWERSQRPGLHKEETRTRRYSPAAPPRSIFALGTALTARLRPAEEHDLGPLPSLLLRLHSCRGELRLDLLFLSMLSISQIVDVCGVSPLAPTTFSSPSMAGAARAHPRPRLGSRIDHLHLMFLPASPICRIMAARVVFRAHRRARSPSAVASAAWATPWPRFAPRWLRHRPRVTLVASVADLVAHRADFALSGKLPAAGHGEPPRRPLFRWR